MFLDFYNGAYGATIRIDVSSLEDLVWLRNIFSDMASLRKMDITISDSMNIRGNSGVSLQLGVTSKMRLGDKSLRMNVLSGSMKSFTWTKDNEGWKESAGLVEGLIMSDRPAHQYLTTEGIDDALIELSYKNG